MGRNLTSLPISASFQYLLQKSGSEVNDGLGADVDYLNISASYAYTASVADSATSATSASYATTATSASHAVNSDTAISASFATTASYAENAGAGTLQQVTDAGNETTNAVILKGTDTSGGIEFHANFPDTSGSIYQASGALILEVEGNGSPGATSPDMVFIVSGSTVMDLDASKINAEVDIDATGVDIVARNITASGEFSGILNGRAATGSAVEVFGDATNAERKLVFVNDNPSDGSSQVEQLRGDTSKSITYNPSTNVLTVPNTTTTASYATQALSASYAPAGDPFPYTGSADVTGSIDLVGGPLILSSTGGTSLNTDTSGIEGNVLIGGFQNTISNGNALGLGHGIYNSYDSTISNTGWNGVIIGSNTCTISGNGQQNAILAGSSITISSNSSMNAVVASNGGSISGTSTRSGILGGQNNSLSANYAAVVAGENNQVSGGQRGAVVGGYNNNQSGNNGVILGGANNTNSSDQYTAIVGGSSNSITGGAVGGNSVLVGGSSNSVGHNNSVVLGGSSLTTTKDSEVVVPNLTTKGTVVQNVTALTITSNTASLDASTGNMFTLGLQNAADTHLELTNQVAGQTFQLKLTNNATAAGTISFDTQFEFEGGTPFTATAATNAVDILTFTCFGGNVQCVGSKNFS